jgi:hypothetical protein
VTTGSVEPLSKLHALWGDEVAFVDVVIRQAHPGPGAPTYRNFEEKMRDAEAYQREFGIEWPVLVDDLGGTTHQVYGGLADPTYLIDRDGRVAFYVMWTHAPTLHKAIEQLMRQDGRGVAGGGMDRTPHILPAMTDGWNGLRRGLPQSLIDMETAAPTTGVSAWLGHQLRPLLAPLTLRATPLPPAAKAGLALGAAALGVLVVQSFRRDSRRDGWMRSFSRLWR